ncbi:MAG: hypothetical protein WD768_17190 [Phycisphaeraceae bacterium]
MRRQTFTFSFTLAAALLAALLARPIQAAEKTAADLLPASTLIYVEVPQPKKLISTLLDHPLREKLEANDGFKAFYQSPRFRQLSTGLAVFEHLTKMKWREALESMSAGGLYIAFDPTTNGVAFLMKSDDAATFKKLDEVIGQLADDNPEGNLKRGRTYRGIATYKVGPGGMAFHGNWFLGANNPELGKVLFDNLLDSSTQTLAADKEFTAARKHGFATDTPTLWAFARTQPLRSMGILDQLFAEKSDNPALELLVGGLKETIQHSPYLTASLRVKADALGLSFAGVHDPAKVSKARDYFFGPTTGGSAPKPLKPPGTALSIVTYRDIGAMLGKADELFTENVAAGIAQADSQLSLFFGDRSFTYEVLGNFRPQMQLVATRQTFEGVTPAIKLPAGALIFQVKPDDQLTKDQFESAFSSAVGLISVTGMQEGRPALKLRTMEKNGVLMSSATYVFDPKKSDKNKAEIYFNASPTLAITKDRIILSSSKQLADDLVKAAAAQSGDTRIGQNTLIELDGPMVHAMLKDNAEFLISQNMIEKGHPREDAETEIGMLLELVSYVKGAAIDLSFQSGHATLNLDVKFNLPK